KGDLAYLEAVSKRVSIPVLRKDFIVDPYQVYEAKAFGADAILLIVSILSKTQLKELAELAHELDLECLVECYLEEEAELISDPMYKIIGVNNRDLNTFDVDLHR